MPEERQTQEKNRSKEIEEDYTEPSQRLTPKQARSLGLTVEPDVAQVWVYGATFDVSNSEETDEIIFIKEHLGRVSGTFDIIELISIIKTYSNRKSKKIDWFSWIIIIIGILISIGAIYVQTMRHP